MAGCPGLKSLWTKFRGFAKRAPTPATQPQLEDQVSSPLSLFENEFNVILAFRVDRRPQWRHSQIVIFFWQKVFRGGEFSRLRVRFGRCVDLRNSDDVVAGNGTFTLLEGHDLEFSLGIGATCPGPRFPFGSSVEYDRSSDHRLAIHLDDPGDRKDFREIAIHLAGATAQDH